MKFRIAGVDLGQAVDPAALAMLEVDRLGSDEVGPVDLRTKCVALRQFPLGLDYNELADEVLDYGADALVPEHNGVGRPVVDILRKRARERGYRGRIHPVLTAASHVRPKLNVDEQKRRQWVVPKSEIVSSINVLQRQGGSISCAKCGRTLPAAGMRCTAAECKVWIKPDDKGMFWLHGFEGSLHGPWPTQDEARRAARELKSEGYRSGGMLLLPSRDKVPETALLYSQLADFERRQSMETGMVSYGNRPGRNHHDDLVMALGIACWWTLRFFAGERSKELSVLW